MYEFFSTILIRSISYFTQLGIIIIIIFFFVEKMQKNFESESLALWSIFNFKQC